MDITVSTNYNGLRLLSSGTLLITAGQSLQMNIEAGSAAELTVSIAFYGEPHPDGQRFDKALKPTQADIDFEIFGCDDGLPLVVPNAHIVSYSEEGIEQAIYLQFSLKYTVESGPLSFAFAWFIGDPPALKTQAC